MAGHIPSSLLIFVIVYSDTGILILWKTEWNLKAVGKLDTLGDALCYFYTFSKSTERRQLGRKQTVGGRHTWQTTMRLALGFWWDFWQCQFPNGIPALPWLLPAQQQVTLMPGTGLVCHVPGITVSATAPTQTRTLTFSWALAPTNGS